jgi:hypothetical protein
MMADQLEQRTLTIVKAPTTKVGADKKSTYISMLVEHNGAEEWYYVDKDCPQWDDYATGDLINAQVKVFPKKNGGNGYDVKKMQKVEGSAPAAQPSQGNGGQPKASPKSSEFRSPDQIMWGESIATAAQLHPDNVNGLLDDATTIYIRAKYGIPAVEEAKLAAIAMLGSPEPEFPEFD